MLPDDFKISRLRGLYEGKIPYKAPLKVQEQVHAGDYAVPHGVRTSYLLVLNFTFFPKPLARRSFS